MKLIVLHGNDSQKSYDRLQKFISEAKRRSWKITEFSLQEIENQNLFGEECFYVLDDWKLLDVKLLEKLKKYSGNLVIYSKSTIPAPSLKKINPDTVEKFELPIKIWKFLDNITVKSLKEIVKTEAVEYVFAMIAWKLKQKYLKDPNYKNAKAIEELALIDIKSKTSNANLLTLLDVFVAKHL